MPYIPTYTKREFIKIPGVDSAAAAPVRQAANYDNTLGLVGNMLPSVMEAISKVSDWRDSLKNTAPAAPDSPADLHSSDDKNLDARQAMLNSLQKEGDAPAAGVNALERVAVQHFTPQMADGTAARDYAVLRQAAQEAQAQTLSARATQSAETEKALTCQVGSLVRSPQALGEYLSGQLPAYEERLRRTGASEASVRAHSRALRAQTVQENINSALACGDWQSAGATLSQHGDQLSESVRQTAADKTRALFAHSQAEKLWEKSRLETGGTAAQVYQHALEQLAESDEELNVSMRQTLQAVSRREIAREHALASQTLSCAAQMPSADAVRLLDGKNALPAEELAQLRQAALFFDGDTTRSDAAQFVACYFDGSQKEHARLRKHEKLSARDYVRLEASRHRRQSGESQHAQDLLCRGIDVWMKKKGFSEQDVSAAQYAVLTADVPTGSMGDVWKQIKNLLDV